MVVPLPEVERFAIDCLMSVGAEMQNAQQIASVMSGADYRGHFSHGLNRLAMYVHDLKSKVCDPNAQPSVLKESSSTAWVDGNNGFGAVVGNFCMQLAIKKAKQTGVGWVVAKGSNHFGIASWYSLQAMEEGLLGMAFSNTSPLMMPTRAKSRALGTNPLTLAAPGDNKDAFVLDMATTAVAVGKIELKMKNDEVLPSGWAQDKYGNMTTDAQVAFADKCLIPLGGCEETSGYKGYGLSLLVETFCGILSGAHYGPNIRGWQTAAQTPADLGQCFVAINPEFFAPGFQGRMSDLMGTLRGLEMTDPSKPVLVAGDPERNHMKEVDQQGGVTYQPAQVALLEQLAKDLGVTPLTPAAKVCPCRGAGKAVKK